MPYLSSPSSKQPTTALAGWPDANSSATGGAGEATGEFAGAPLASALGMRMYMRGCMHGTEGREIYYSPVLIRCMRNTSAKP